MLKTKQKFKVVLYIGSDNRTNKINIGYLNKCLAVLNSFYNSFSLEHGTGYYKGTQEQSLKVTIFLDGVFNDIESKIKTVCNLLKTELKQESILYYIENSVYEFV